ncbi:MAG: hypothetical protein CL521_00915 [Actinobacteria bacterium]|nr:hypothetical protein [Actinomycetota bacterium]
MMKKKTKQLINISKIGLFLAIVSAWLVSSSAILDASTKVLPDGIWKLDVYVESYEIDEVAVNGNGDKLDWKKISLADGTIADIKLLTTLNGAFYVNLGPAYQSISTTTKLAHYWKKQKAHLDIAYGLTDKLTLFTNISYENAVLDYTDEYQAESKKIDEQLALLDTPYNRAPDKAIGENLNDIYIGAKYRFLNHMAVAVKGTFGDLRTGVDAREKKVEDNQQELETGKSYDEFHGYLFADYEIGMLPLRITTGYVWKGDGYQNFLDNKKIDINLGDVIILGLGTELKLPLDINTEIGITHLITGKDKYKGGNSNTLLPTAGYSDWTEVPDSDTSATMASISMTKSLKKFLRVYANASLPIAHNMKGQLYDFPGRLEPSTTIKLGMTLFLK